MEPSYCAAVRMVDEGVLVVAIGVGEIREPTMAYDLRNEMLSLVKSSAAEHLVIDAHNLIFMGSVGFLAFLGLRREFSGRIILCNLAKPVRDSFALCRLIQDKSNHQAPFEAAGTLDDALKLFSAG
jgi:anti-anti-sigma factor